MGSGEFHSAPILVPRVVLPTKFDPPWLVRGALRRRNMSLELNGIGASEGGGIDKGVRLAQTSVMALRDLCDDKTIAVPTGIGGRRDDGVAKRLSYQGCQ